MEPTTAAAGSGRALTINGQDVIVPPLTAADHGVMFGHVVRHARNKVMEDTAAMRPHLSDAQWEKEVDRARERADEIENALTVRASDTKEVRKQKKDAVTHAIEDFYTSIKGSTMLIWVALENSYPGRFTQADVMQAMNAKTEEARELKRLADSEEHRHGGQLGNSSDENGQPPPPKVKEEETDMPAEAATAMTVTP